MKAWRKGAKSRRNFKWGFREIKSLNVGIRGSFVASGWETAAVGTLRGEPVTSWFPSNVTPPGQRPPRWSLTLKIMNSQHGIWRATQGKPAMRYYSSIGLSGGMVSVSSKEEVLYGGRSCFCAVREVCEVDNSSLASFLQEKHRSLRWSSSSCWHVIKQVVCGVVCQLYGIVTRHKGRHTLCMLWQMHTPDDTHTHRSPAGCKHKN